MPGDKKISALDAMGTVGGDDEFPIIQSGAGPYRTRSDQFLGDRPKSPATKVVAASDTPNAEARADYVCSGVDDQVEIQAAIDAVAVSGGKVVLLEGSFKISDGIYLDDYVTLEGHGFNTWIEATAKGTASPEDVNHFSMCHIIDKVYVTVKNIRWDANNLMYYGIQTYATALDDLHHIWIEGNYVYEAGDDEIGIEQYSKQVMIRDNYCRTTTWLFGGPSNIEVQDGATEIWILNNHCDGTYNINHAGYGGCVGIKIFRHNAGFGESPHIVVRDNLLTNNRANYAIYATEGVVGVIIAGNQIVDPTGGGIQHFTEDMTSVVMNNIILNATPRVNFLSTPINIVTRRLTIESNTTSDVDVVLRQGPTSPSWIIGLDHSADQAFALAYRADGLPSLTGNYLVYILKDGTLRWGITPGANYLQVAPNGDITFVGTAGFYPRRLSQAAIPASGVGATQIDVGEYLIWRDTDDNKTYLVYNDTDVGVRSVEMT